jgi:hypothetical protein
VVAGLILAACTTDRASDTPEAVGQVTSALWTNGGFETGAAGAAPTGWTVNSFINNGITVQTPQTFAGLNLAMGGNALTTTIAATNQPDPNLGAGASLRVCRYGAQCARVNFHSSMTYGNGQNVNILSQTMTVAAGDVDPSDSQVHVRFTIAPVLQNPAHPANEQPYYFVLVNDLTQGTTLYSDFNLSGTAGLAWQRVNAGTANEIDYTDWQLIDVSGAGGAIAQGDSVEIRVIGAGCSLGGHFGEVYVDGVGSVVPGLTVQGTAPAQANAGTNIAYTLGYKNGSAASAAAETGVVIDFATPPNTTFQSVTPPAGATCTTPAVGAAGTIACTFSGSVASGASGTFSVTVAIAAGTTGTITEGNYSIRSNQETALLGPPIFTQCGCAQDSNCPAGQWCNESASDCTPTLANGTAMPTDVAHANPTLNGTCTAAAGALVCTSAVCDTRDNDCGYANGDGPCTATNGVIDCRSGACSTNGTCEPAGGCNVDADCTSGRWCNETSHTCTPKIGNGGALPTDAAHANPTLDGTCTAAAGTLVCTSGVCDTRDNECGYVNGDGPCTATNGATVCRSGACSTNGTCVPAGGCNVDADCASGNWCTESSHACTPKIGNGGALPTDGAHANPTLDGTCTAAAGALVCTSGVCDTRDNECGYANGDGPCTATNDVTVCRSGACSTGGTCEPAGGCAVDSDCTSGHYCDESTHTCTAKVANGGAVPTDPAHTNPTLDGTCTAAAGALACASGVCDTDNACGYKNGDGPCTPGDGGATSVCRSGLCAPSGDAGGVCVVCVTDGDCPTGQVCSASKACVVPAVDAGPADGGLPDGDAGEDAAEGAAADAPADAPADAAAQDAPPDAAAETAADSAGATDAAEAASPPVHGDATVDGGYIEGGGCSAAGGRRSGGNEVPGSMLGALSVLGVLAMRRRRSAAGPR